MRGQAISETQKKQRRKMSMHTPYLLTHTARGMHFINLVLTMLLLFAERCPDVIGFTGGCERIKLQVRIYVLNIPDYLFRARALSRKNS